MTNKLGTTDESAYPHFSFAQHVDKSIEKSLLLQDRLDEAVLRVKGFSTPTMRCLIANLCQLPLEEIVYLECGVYCGATFCAAIHQNPRLIAYGIDNFSQSFRHSSIQWKFEANLAKWKMGAKEVHFIVEDCFKLDPMRISYPVNVYFYDGEHSFQSQRNALPHYLSCMAQRFIMVVDDYNWPEVKGGTEAGIDSLTGLINVEHVRILRGAKGKEDPVWHNGLGVFVIERMENAGENRPRWTTPTELLV